MHLLRQLRGLAEVFVYILCCNLLISILSHTKHFAKSNFVLALASFACMFNMDQNRLANILEILRKILRLREKLINSWQYDFMRSRQTQPIINYAPNYEFVSFFLHLLEINKIFVIQLLVAFHIMFLLYNSNEIDCSFLTFSAEAELLFVIVK